jgi:hypothetical protein
MECRLRPPWRVHFNYDGVVSTSHRPHIVRLGCGCPLMAKHRQQIVPKARGRVLEIGPGAGANIRFYDVTNVTHVWGIEPSHELRARRS